MIEKEENLKFLEDNGFACTIDEDGAIKEIINLSSGEKLQRILPSKEKVSELERMLSYLPSKFESSDKSTSIEIDTLKIEILQDGLKIIKFLDFLDIFEEHQANFVIIKFVNRKTDKFKYSEVSDFGAISVYTRLSNDNWEEKEKIFDLIQVVLESQILRTDDGSLKMIPLETEKMFCQEILDYIRQIISVTSNSKINAKLHLVAAFVQKLLNENLNNQPTDRIISCLKAIRSGIATEISRLEEKKEKIDNAFLRINSPRKKM